MGRLRVRRTRVDATIWAELEQLNYQYAHAVDDIDLELIGDCFTSDAVFDIGSPDVDMPAQGRVAIVAAISARRRAAEGVRRHLITNIIVRGVDDDGTILAECVLALAATTVRGTDIAFSARYSDHVVRDEDGHLRLAKRMVHRDRVGTGRPGG